MTRLGGDDVKKNMLDILYANSNRYNESHQVDDYLATAYHHRRIMLAIDLLNSELSDCFGNYRKNEIKILELASSTGTVGKIIQDMGYSIIVSDCEVEPLYAAKEKGLKAVKFDVTERFPFEDKAFHAVFAGELIEHIFNTDFLLSECHRVLIDGGILLLTTPNLATIQDRFKFVFGYSPRQINPLHEFYNLHIRPFTYRMLEEVLLNKKFEPRKLLSNYVCLKVGTKKLINSKILARFFPKIGGTLILSSKKVNS